MIWALLPSRSSNPVCMQAWSRRIQSLFFICEEVCAPMSMAITEGWFRSRYNWKSPLREGEWGHTWAGRMATTKTEGGNLRVLFTNRNEMALKCCRSKRFMFICSLIHVNSALWCPAALSRSGTILLALTEKKNKRRK